jgi:hypothetical protein
MNRETALKVLLALLGLFFVAGLYPLLTSIPRHNQADFPDQMLLSIYAVLGVSLLLAIRNPSANRSLIAFTAWGNLAHASIMAVQSVQLGTERSELPPLGAAALICVVLLWLLPDPPKRAQGRND